MAKDARLLTRTGLDWTHRYGSIAAALTKLKIKTAYVDGELCAVREDGTTSFAELQDATDHQETWHLVYFAFDLLFLDGQDLMHATAARPEGAITEPSKPRPR